MKPATKIAGVVLAGGGSRRMAGQDKSWLSLDGRTLADHAVSNLCGQLDAVAVNTNEEDPRFQAFGLPVLADCLPGRLGPLVGVLTAMEWAITRNATHAATLPIDTPFAPNDFVGTLQASLQTAPVIAHSAGRDHPVIGLWPVALAPSLRAALDEGQRRIGFWAKAQNCNVVTFEPRNGVDPFFNINTEADLLQARTLFDA